jgi:hypothetical protein
MLGRSHKFAALFLIVALALSFGFVDSLRRDSMKMK